MQPDPTKPMNAPALTQQSVRNLVNHWYFLLDVHADVADVRALLHPDTIVLQFPEATLNSVQQFETWYEGVVRIFFDEVHDMQKLEIEVADDGRSAEVDLVVRWLARRWNPPSPRSEWLGFNAAQRWTIGIGPGGNPAITRYVVDALEPIPGSAAL